MAVFVDRVIIIYNLFVDIYISALAEQADLVIRKAYVFGALEFKSGSHLKNVQTEM